MGLLKLFVAFVQVLIIFQEFFQFIYVIRFVCKIISDIPLLIFNFYSICCDDFSFISNISNLCLLSFFLANLFRSSYILLVFNKSFDIILLCNIYMQFYRLSSKPFINHIPPILINVIFIFIWLKYFKFVQHIFMTYVFCRSMLFILYVLWVFRYLSVIDFQFTFIGI